MTIHDITRLIVLLIEKNTEKKIEERPVSSIFFIQKKPGNRPDFFAKRKCGRRDLNPHGIATTGT
jgi:hypothetical protein